jgi:hypothetical protein
MSDHPNSGALFANDDRKTDNHPTHSGSLDAVQCPCCGESSDFWLSAWVKTSKAGRKFFSLSVRPKDAPRQAGPLPPAKPEPAKAPDDFDDSIPF